MNRPECPPAQAEQELAGLRELLPDWDVWHVPAYTGPAPCNWCAMPEGARTSAVTAGTPDELVKAAAEYAAHLDEHIEQARTELDETPQTLPGRISVLEARLLALLALREKGRHSAT